MSKCLVLFVEGDTEVEFYKAVIAFAKGKRENKTFDTCIECKNVKGVGGFKKIALRKFVKEIKTHYDRDCEYTVVLCSDTDVFEVEPKPPVIWKDIEDNMRSSGAKTVIMVKAKESIEDWFLYDSDNIISFLKLKKNTKISGRNGYDKLKRLYERAGKMYFKGRKSNGMVAQLDIEKISIEAKGQLAPLFELLGVKI